MRSRSPCTAGTRGELVENSGHHGAAGEVCRLHSEVVGAPALPADAWRPGHPGTAAGPLARANWTEARPHVRRDPQRPPDGPGVRPGDAQPRRDEQLAADAALVVTELATNAVVHAESAFTVGLLLSEDMIRISVEDSVPLSSPAGSLAASAPGHGLGVVAAMAVRWGVETEADGKAVWAELAIPG